MGIQKNCAAIAEVDNYYHPIFTEGAGLETWFTLPDLKGYSSPS